MHLLPVPEPDVVLPRERPVLEFRIEAVPPPLPDLLPLPPREGARHGRPLGTSPVLLGLLRHVDGAVDERVLGLGPVVELDGPRRVVEVPVPPVVRLLSRTAVGARDLVPVDGVGLGGRGRLAGPLGCIVSGGVILVRPIHE